MAMPKLIDFIPYCYRPLIHHLPLPVRVTLPNTIEIRICLVHPPFTMSVAGESLNKLRRFVWPPFHRLFTSVSDAYAVTQTTEDEYAVTVMEPLEPLEERLPELGFRRTPISSLKIRVDGNVSDGSWIFRESKLADTQLHIVLHELPNKPAVDVYAHVEDNWISHPLLHLRKKNYDAEEGVIAVRDLFEANESTSALRFEIMPRYRRDGQWLLYLLHFVSKSAARWVHKRFSEPLPNSQ